jgi:hypothetical protein
VEFFLEQQIAAVKSSRRQALLAALAAKDLEDLRALVEPALPSGDNDSVAQVRLMRKVYEYLSRRKDEGARAVAEQKFPELESADSQYAYLIRLLSYVDERELHPVPESFSQQKADVREKYVTEQWKVWRRTALQRVRKALAADWGGIGLESEEECGQFLEAIAQQVGLELAFIFLEIADGFVFLFAPFCVCRRAFFVRLCLKFQPFFGGRLFQFPLFKFGILKRVLLLFVCFALLDFLFSQ